MSRALLQLALDALETCTPGDYSTGHVIDPSYDEYAVEAAIAAIRAALDTPQPEPVAWQFQDRNGRWCDFIDDEHRLNTVDDGSWPIRALYTEPAPAALQEDDVRIPTSEPVAWLGDQAHPWTNCGRVRALNFEPGNAENEVPLYTAPPKETT